MNDMHISWLGRILKFSMFLQYSQSRLRCCHCVSPGSLDVLGHFSLLHRVFLELALTGLNGRFIMCIYSDEIYEYVFHVFKICGVQVFWIYLYRILLFIYLFISNMPPNSSGTMQQHGYFFMFQGQWLPGKIYPRFFLLLITMGCFTLWNAQWNRFYTLSLKLFEQHSINTQPFYFETREMVVRCSVFKIYRKLSNIRRTKSQNLNASRPIL